MYEVVGSKGATVADLWEISGSKGGWNFKFKRHFNDWEMEVVQNFMSIMNSRSYRPQLSDKLCWKETNSGSYSVKSYFNLLEGRRLRCLSR